MSSPYVPPPPPPPKEFWEDLEWADAHMDEISAAHPDQWVAIVDRRVVASGPILADVESHAISCSQPWRAPGPPGGYIAGCA